MQEAEESLDDEGYSSGGFLTPDEYQPSPPRHRRLLEEEDPEYDPSAEQDIESPTQSPRRQRRVISQVVEDVIVSTPQPSSTTTSTSKIKRKRGQRSVNQIPTLCLVVEEVSPRGKPILPEGIWARFQNITTNDWKKVTDSIKESMWATLQACFRFPEGKPKEDAKKFAMITLGTAFRNFRHTLHNDYANKGLSPKIKFGKIPDAMWEEFKLMKEMAEAKALSEKMTEKAQKAAENPHHLGAEGKVVFENPTTAEIDERLAQIVDAEKQGLFHPDREKDQLTAAIGTAEHSGHVRGQGYLVPNTAQANQEVIVAQSGLIALSNVGSMTQHKYPVDDIQVDTPCMLVVPYRRKLNKFREVATTMAVMGHVFPRPLAPEYAWVQVVKVMDSTCELNITTDDVIEVLGDAINQYVQWHRRDIILQGCLSQELQPLPEANIEHATLSPVPEENNHEQDQTTLVDNDRVDDFPRHDPTPAEANIETQHPVLPSLKSVAKITKMPSPQAPPKMTKIPRMITTYGKAPSADVDKFLRAMNKMPSSSKNKEKEPLQKDFDVRDLFSYEVEITPKNYEHSKSFLAHVDLQLSPWELIKFHAWIMKVMKHGIKEITAMVPPFVFNNPVPHQIVIDFEDLHRLYRR
ncbi:hypothetical protein PVAP13_9NG369900 [Panicum virgatum]|uniref:DUF8039 domain-containing protein n=1 Tax=Panicum virgatum TaxID=38727 RepID=A0A8T0MPH8_PANVG|nr:hypothetical protein PVAP13_9NG369900 [Panicum virgatum]